jgi:plastocyanin/methionine-rich copper-binding protein CopC
MSQSRFNKWLPVLAVVSILVLAVAACSNDEVTPDDVVKAGSEQVSTTQTDEAMEDGESDEAMMDGESDEAMMDADSDEAMMDSKSDEEMMDGESDEAMMDSKSDEEMMDGESDEAMMDAKSDEEMMDGESDEAMMDAKSDEEMMAGDSDEAMMDVALPDNIVAPHFVGSFPLHGDMLPQAPEVIVLNFNFNLHEDSSIMVSRGGEPVAIETAEIAEDQLSMRASLGDAGHSGVYRVDYIACWPDGSCHEGTIGFSVDSSALMQFEDLGGSPEVVVNMTGGDSFGSPRVVVDAGTRVTWVNTDSVIHFVNSDPHPSHNVQSAMNSSALSPGESYSFTFDVSGVWGYHCSAHHGVGMVA